MRFITWNCGKGLPTALPHLVALNPDIACLQEVKESDLHVLPEGYAARYTSAHPNKGVALLYKPAHWQLSAPVLAADIVAAVDLSTPHVSAKLSAPAPPLSKSHSRCWRTYSARSVEWK